MVDQVMTPGLPDDADHQSPGESLEPLWMRGRG